MVALTDMVLAALNLAEAYRAVGSEWPERHLDPDGLTMERYLPRDGGAGLVGTNVKASVVKAKGLGQAAHRAATL